jgi:hypothetical protein
MILPAEARRGFARITPFSTDAVRGKRVLLTVGSGSTPDFLLGSRTSASAEYRHSALRLPSRSTRHAPAPVGLNLAKFRARGAPAGALFLMEPVVGDSPEENASLRASLPIPPPRDRVGSNSPREGPAGCRRLPWPLTAPLFGVLEGAARASPSSGARPSPQRRRCLCGLRRLPLRDLGRHGCSPPGFTQCHDLGEANRRVPARCAGARTERPVAR